MWKHTIKQENNIYITLKSKIKGTLRPKPELAQGQKGQKLYVSERLHHRECPQNGPLPLGPHLTYDSFDPPECMPQTTSIISLTIFVRVTSCVQQRDIPTTPHLQQKATPLHSTLLLLLHTFNGPLSGTTQVSRYQKGKTNLDFTEARDSAWQWHQLGHMQICTSLQTNNHASTPPLSFLQAGCSSCHPTNSVKALKAKVMQQNINKSDTVARKKSPYSTCTETLI